LANSRKLNGHCIAGKDLNTGEWIRLINNKDHPFSDSDLKRLCDIESGPKLLDCYKIQFMEKCPEYYQPENERIAGDLWIPLTSFSDDKLSDLEDSIPYEWLGNRTYDFPEHPDQIDPVLLKETSIKKSLIFQKMNYLTNESEIIYFSERNGIRPSLRFICNGIRYKLKITDITISQSPSSRPVTQRLHSAYATIGLGQPYDKAHGAHFKLVVGIIKTKEGIR
jgi:hypothetical protein